MLSSVSTTSWKRIVPGRSAIATGKYGGATNVSKHSAERVVGGRRAVDVERCPFPEHRHEERQALDVVPVHVGDQRVTPEATRRGAGARPRCAGPCRGRGRWDRGRRIRARRTTCSRRNAGFPPSARSGATDAVEGDVHSESPLSEVRDRTPGARAVNRRGRRPWACNTRHTSLEEPRSQPTDRPPLPDGIVAVVKHDCPTCVLVEPVLRALATGTPTPLSVVSQDDPAFPAGVEVIDDRDLGSATRGTSRPFPRCCGSSVASRRSGSSAGIGTSGARSWTTRRSAPTFPSGGRDAARCRSTPCGSTSSGSGSPHPGS